MGVFGVFVVEEFGVDVEDVFHVEGVDFQDALEGSAGAGGFDYFSELVDAGEAVFDPVGERDYVLEGRNVERVNGKITGISPLLLLLTNQIKLIQKNLITKRHLLQRFINIPLRLNFIQMLLNMLRIR